jgi:hypothetical protein
MLYIHQTACISPLPADGSPSRPVNGVFQVAEPSYEGVPGNVLRRMSKCMRLGVGAALPLLRQGARPDGILIGTGNGGMEESVKFLRQIIEYEEGLLAPGQFVQSIPNTIASQIGLLDQNKGYNSTYVHKGLAFEHALIDAAMLLRENPGCRLLVGGVDELSGYHYRIELADGWYKDSIAGEGAAVFLVDGTSENALAAIKGVLTFHDPEEDTVRERLQGFLEDHLPAGSRPDLLLSGEDGEIRARPWYNACETFLGPATTVVRFKQFCGEYPTASAFAVWLACSLGQGHHILIYNNHKLSQHSFILLERYR